VDDAGACGGEATLRFFHGRIVLPPALLHVALDAVARRALGVHAAGRHFTQLIGGQAEGGEVIRAAQSVQELGKRRTETLLADCTDQTGQRALLRRGPGRVLVNHHRRHRFVSWVGPLAEFRTT
jgi:hypothetical protein